MKVLGIETSCDDTGVAVYDSNEGLLVHRLSSQIDIHKLYGGVVPELAARDHIRKLLPLIDAVLEIAKLRKSEIDAVAYTAGPGLIGALLVGATVGRSLAMALEIPSIGVHHMEGHLLSPMLEPLYPSYPFVCLLVSGGHTMLADVQSPGQYKIIGQTRDDAVGEAFDKFAKVLGLPYPGGPSIEKSAKNGASGRFQFPRPMVGGDNLEFSFSGLKTHAALCARDMELNDENVADLACAFQEAAVDTLVAKCKTALQLLGYQELVVAGGVGANQLLRERMQSMTQNLGTRTYFPRLELCTDNGAMIAYAGFLRLRSGQCDNLDFSVRARWSLEHLPPIGNSSNLKQTD